MTETGVRSTRTWWPPGRVAQGVYLLVVGVAWSAYGVILLQDPDYWEPVAVLDHASIWMYSLSLVLSGPAFIILVRRARAGSGATAVAWILALAGLVTGVGNAIEDGFDQEAFGLVYLAGVTPFFLGQILLAILLGLGDRKAYALVPLLTFGGALFFEHGGPILMGLTWIVFGVLVLAGRTAGRGRAPTRVPQPQRERTPET